MRARPDTRARFVATAAIAAGLTLVLSPLPMPRAEDSPILLAMQDEMKRSMADLRMKGEPAPYFIEYEIDDVASMRAVGRLGGVVDDLTDRGRTLRVQVRVGEYEFDSSRFITQDRGVGVVALPLDDNYDAIRRLIWLTTDAAYKRAVSVFAKKKATFQNRAATDALADFSREKPVETLQGVLAPAPSGSTWVERVQQLSALFKSSPGLDSSEVSISDTHGTSYYLNSEGFKTVTPIASVSLRASTEAQAQDGAPVRDLFAIVESRLEDLPPMAALTSRVRDLAHQAVARRTQPVGEEFTGPVLIEGQASAELIRQTLVPLMLARRAADSENGRFSQAQITPFLNRIGLRVLSDSFSVSDTPSLQRYDGRMVAGAYVVDDEAVPAKDVTLVEKGRLVTLLTSRTPQKNLLQSNGHGRSGSVQAGVFQLRSTQAIPASQLKPKYLELLKAEDKAFGYIVRQIAAPGDIPGGGGPGGGPVILDAVKVMADGREEPVRGLRFGDVPSTVFRDILNASEERVLHNYRVNSATAASVIAPNLIFEELEVQRTREIVQKRPVVPSPLAP